MTNEELAARIQAGDGNLMVELWAQVERFVRRQAHRYCTALGLDASMQEDLYQSGYLAMHVAVQSYDESAGAGFLTWLSLNLKTAFREALGMRSAKQQNDPIHRALSLDAPTSIHDENVTLCDTIPGDFPWEDVEDSIWITQAHAVLESALQKLPPIQAEVLRLKYFERYPHSSIASFLGVNIDKIRLEERKAIWTLRHGSSSVSLRALMDGEPISCYQRIGAKQFQRTMESAVEVAVFQREYLAAAQ